MSLLLRWDDQSVCGFRGHLEEVCGTAAFHALDDIDCPAFIDTQPAVHPRQLRAALANLQEAADEFLRRWVFSLLYCRSFYRIGMRRLILLLFS